MGVLDMAAARAGETQPPENTGIEPAGEEGQQGRQRAEDGTFVSAEKLTPQRESSRRNKTQEQIDAALDTRWKSFEEQSKADRQREREAYEQRINEGQRQYAELQHNFARMQGALDEMRSRPAYAPPQQQGPDPAELRRQARAALQEKNNFEDYERLMSEATRIEVEKVADARVKAAIDGYKQEAQKNQPPQIPWHIQQQMMLHQNVARRGPQGLQAVIAEKNRLDIYRTDLTAEAREQLAWQTADKMLGGQQNPGPQRSQGYDPSAAAALSGAPNTNGARPSSGGGDAGVTLTGEAKRAQEKSGMTPEEYVKWGNPWKYNLVK